MQTFILPDSLLLGTATAATQIEGSDPNTNWAAWHRAGRIEHNDSPLTGAGHACHMQEDIDLLAAMHQQTYRLSIEWSRFEPQENRWSEEGTAYYRDELSRLAARGIRPLVTLHHFSHPQWFEEKGQWTSPEAVPLFLRFVERAVRALGGLAADYCTINEPNVFVMSSYMDGDFPPGHKDDLKSYFTAARRLIEAHVKAYSLIHRIRREMGFGDTRVGFAMHYTYLERHPRRRLTALAKGGMDYLFHTLFEKGFIEGRLVPPLGLGRLARGACCDFVGVNYYTRHIIYPGKNPATLFGEPRTGEGMDAGALSDMGWEIYPEGLYRVCRRVAERWQLPIYITENGIADTEDAKRGRFIAEHLHVVYRLIAENVPVERYYYWSLIDNLEWNFGYWPRFGLVEVDYATGRRTLRGSARLYAEICRTHTVSIQEEENA